VQIRAIANNLACFYAYLNIYSADNMNRNNFSEGKSASYDIQLRRLESISEGKIALTLTNGSEVVQASTTSLVASVHKDHAPIFDLDASTEWAVDSDRLEAVSNDRD